MPLLAGLLVPAAIEAVRSRSARPVLDVPVRLIDEGSYAVGVWQGVLQELSECIARERTSGG